eukprot:scaffold6494_cov109-Cylindrotheca_fusiformis.AAC.3
MPTFQSIPLHPLLKKRLLEPPNDDGVSIATPQALLSRTPQALADQLMIGTNSNSNSNSTNTNNSSTTTPPSNRKPTDAIWNQIDTLRSQVAHAMISQTKMGTYRLRQQQFLDDRQKQLNHNNNNDDSSYHAMVRPLVLGATINALQALQYETERQLGQEEVSTLSTGCRALDELLSLPDEYNNIINNIINNNDNHIAKGFPRGHVCSISGPSKSGKTQLCLQLAAQAALLLSTSSSSCPRRRVRYCYSTAGQVGTSLAHRLAQLMTTTTTTSSLLAVEFQPIRSTTQLITILSSLEDEWLLLLESSSQQQQQQQQQQLPFLLVVDSLSNLEIQDEDQLGRIAGHWLKRLARQYSIWVVYVTGSTTTTTTAAAADFQLACHPTNQGTAIITTLLRHPARLDQPSISLFYTPSGMTTKASPEPQEE